MIYYNQTAGSEGIDVTKSNESKECNICHYWYSQIKVSGFKRMAVMIY